MSQTTDPPKAIASSPIPGHASRKGVGAALILLATLGAFGGAAAGTYVTFAYIILPHIPTGSNNNGGNNGNNNNCTTNCGSNGGGQCGTGCLQGVITGNNSPSSPYVKLDGINATSSNTISFTWESVGASQLTGNSVVVTDTTNSQSGTNSCPSGQTCSIANSPSTQQMTFNSLTFKTGDTYTIQFNDSGNTSTYNFHF